MNSSHLNIIFAGTSIFSAVVLEGLLQSEHTIKAVYTPPDRPAGRGRKLTMSPVKQLALDHALPLFQPASLKEAEEQQRLTDFKADVMIVVVYSLLLPKAVLHATRLGCLNIHPSLLPRWRGAAPVHHAILAGDTKTGVTLMQMDEGWDTGPLLYKNECDIALTDTTATLDARLALLGKDMLLTALPQLSQLTPQPQNNALATYAHKISKEDACLDWGLSAEELDRKIRGFNPWPVAYCPFDDAVLRIWEATVIQKDVSAHTPGKILESSAKGIDIATGKNILRLLKLQLPGKKILPVADILNAYKNKFSPGKIL